MPGRRRRVKDTALLLIFSNYCGVLVGDSVLLQALQYLLHSTLTLKTVHYIEYIFSHQLFLTGGAYALVQQSFAIKW